LSWGEVVEQAVAGDGTVAPAGDGAFACWLAERAGAALPSPDVNSQLTWTALGLALLVAVLLLVRDHRRLQRFTYTSLLLGLILLLLPLAPYLGYGVRGATLWIRIGDYSFQPGELAKILLTVFLAGYLSAKRDSLALVRTKVLGLEFPRGRDLGPLLVAWVVSLAILVFETDLGTSLLFFGLAVCLLYVATQRRSWLVLGTVLFVSGAARPSRGRILTELTQLELLGSTRPRDGGCSSRQEHGCV